MISDTLSTIDELYLQFLDEAKKYLKLRTHLMKITAIAMQVSSFKFGEEDAKWQFLHELEFDSIGDALKGLKETKCKQLEALKIPLDRLDFTLDTDVRFVQQLSELSLFVEEQIGDPTVDGEF